MIPLIHHASQWGRSEVVLFYPDSYTCYTAIAPPCARNLSMRRPTTKDQGSRGFCQDHILSVSQLSGLWDTAKSTSMHTGTDPWLHKNKRDRLLDLFGIMLPPWIDRSKQWTRNQLIVDDDCWWSLSLSLYPAINTRKIHPIVHHVLSENHSCSKTRCSNYR